MVACLEDQAEDQVILNPERRKNVKNIIRWLVAFLGVLLAAAAIAASVGVFSVQLLGIF